MLIGVNKEKLHEHFFVLPFRCEKCGNVFMLERGLRKTNSCYCDLLDRLDGIGKYVKYCGICSQEIAKESENNE
jgi:hypothetical protein